MTVRWTGAALALVVMLPAVADAEGPDPAVCRKLQAYRGGVDVHGKPVAGADFTPGVDARGRAVAPADLPQAPTAPMRFDIPVTLDFLRAAGVRVPATGGMALPGTTQLGQLSIQGNQVLFNGQPLGAGADARIYAACGVSTR